MRLPPPLLALSPGDLGSRKARTADRSGGVEGFLDRVASAFGAGLRGVLLREPLLADGVLFDLVGRLRRAPFPAAGQERLWVGVHDRPHVALAWIRASRTETSAVDGVHLGFRSLSPERVRALFDAEGERAPALGLSTHVHDQLESGDGVALPPAEIVDYLVHGPVRDTPSKRGLLEAIGIEGLARACAKSTRPIWAIGGLRPQDAADVRASGAAGMAVLRGVLGSSDPAAAVRDYAGGWAS